VKDNGGNLVDRAVDAVGYQAVDNGGAKEQPNVRHIPVGLHVYTCSQPIFFDY
jgi:hypothetical protein